MSRVARDRDLSPADAIVALRSLPRRFTEVFAGAADTADGDGDGDGGTVAPAYRPDADGWTPVGHLVAAARAVGLATAALRALWRDDDPEVAREAVDTARRVRDPAPGGPVGDRCAELAWEVDALVELAGGHHGDDWARTATVEGTREQVRALDVLRVAVDDAVGHLTSARAALGGRSGDADPG